MPIICLAALIGFGEGEEEDAAEGEEGDVDTGFAPFDDDAVVVEILSDDLKESINL